MYLNDKMVLIVPFSMQLNTTESIVARCSGVFKYTYRWNERKYSLYEEVLGCLLKYYYRVNTMLFSIYPMHVA